RRSSGRCATLPERAPRSRLEQERIGAVLLDGALELPAVARDVRLVRRAHAEHGAHPAGGDELVHVSEEVAHAVVPVAPRLAPGDVAGHAQGHLPPEQGPLYSLRDGAGPLEVLVEVGAALVRLVPVPGAVLPLTVGVLARFEAA